MLAKSLFVLAAAGLAAAQTIPNASQSSALRAALSSLLADVRTDTQALSAFAALATDPAAQSIAADAQSIAADADFYTNTAAAISLYTAIAALPSSEAAPLLSLISAEASIINSVFSTTFSLPQVTPTGGAVAGGDDSDSDNDSSTVLGGTTVRVTTTPRVSGTTSSGVAQQTTNAAPSPAYVKAAGVAVGVFGAAVALL